MINNAVSSAICTEENQLIPNLINFGENDTDNQ